MKRTTARSLWMRTLQSLALLLVVVGCSDQRSEDELLSDATQALEAGQRDAAARDLKIILDRDANNAVARFLNAKLLEVQEQHEAAVTEYLKVPAGSGQGYESRVRAGMVALKLNRASQAENQWRSAQQLDPSGRGAAENLMQLYALQRRRAGLVTQLEIIAANRPLNVSEMLLESLGGRGFFSLEKTQTILEQLCAAHADDEHSAIALALYYSESSRAQDAISILRKTLKKNPESKTVRAMLARLLIETEDVTPSDRESSDELLRSLELDEKMSPEFWRGVGAWLARKEKLPAAAASYAKLIETESNDGDAWRRLAGVVREFKQAQLADDMDHRVMLIGQLEQALNKVMQALNENASVEASVRETLLAYVKLHDDYRARVWATVINESPESPAWKDAFQHRSAISSESLLERLPNEVQRVSLGEILR